MGLDDLLDDASDDSNTSTVSEASTTTPTGSTSPSTDTLPNTKNCPNCGEECGLFDDVWECKNSWCRVEFFLTEKGHFIPSVEEDDGFLSSYSV
jgi:hypothetical protein